MGVIGVGYFGRIHALKLAANPRIAFAGVADADPERARAVAAETGAPALPAEALLALAEAVVVAAPAALHFEIAARALSAGRHVLVEKPIAATLEQADRLGAIAAEKKLVLQVGHLERFSAAHQAVSSRLSEPIYIEAVRVAPYKPRGTDVSVILDLMIHDLDLVLALTESPLVSVEAVGAPVAGANDDIANARLRFASGQVATITASRISFKTERKMRIFAREGYLAVDFSARRLTRIGRGTGAAIPGMDGFAVEEVSWEEHDPLAAEHEAFLDSLSKGAPVVVDAPAGRRALDAALRVGAAIAESRARLVASGLVEQLEHSAGGSF